MRPKASFLGCALILLTVLVSLGVDEEDYLGVIGPTGTVSEANYSQYAPAFRAFVTAGPVERNLSAYPAYLGSFLDQPPETAVINYGNYTPAFGTFMTTGPAKRNLSAYPAYVGRFLDQPTEIAVINYSDYTPAFGEFMGGRNESRGVRLSLESYPAWMRAYLES